MNNIEPSGERFNEYLQKIEWIDYLVSTTNIETAMFSTHRQMIIHPNFQALVDMGDILVNYIFHKMFEYGSNWVYLELLRQIVKNDPPINLAGNFYGQVTFWMNWYLTSEYYNKNDIYHNLITK